MIGERAGSVLVRQTDGLMLLAKKVVDELLDIGQFADSRRRDSLFRNGLSHLRGMTYPFEGNTQILAKALARSLTSKKIDFGIEIAVSPPVPIVAVIFPENSQVFFSTPGQKGKFDVFGAFVSSPTVAKSPARDGFFYPDQGYKDSNGIAFEFIPRRLEDRVQHGGIMVDNERGKIRLLNYDRLAEEREGEMAGPKVIMEANWYMDSANQDDVVNRGNIQQPRIYNSFGIFVDDEGKERYFTLSSCRESVEEITEIITGSPRKNKNRVVHLREFAAMANVLALRGGFRFWQMAGLEYHTGGTTFTQRMSGDSHFVVNIGKPS